MRRAALALSLLCTAALCLVAAARARLASAPPAPVLQAQEENGHVPEVEVITATPFGFEPAEVTRRPGRFVLAVHNNSGAAELSLRLDRVQGDRLREVRMDRGRHHSHQDLALPPGEYVLTEAGRPDWACRIRIAP